MCVRLCSEADIASAKQEAGSAAGAKLAWDAPNKDEDITQQPQHAKVGSSTQRAPLAGDCCCSVLHGWCAVALTPTIVCVSASVHVRACTSCALTPIEMLLLQVIGKGVPDDAMPGIPDKQVPLPDTLNNFNGLYNSQGSKVNPCHGAHGERHLPS